jgi:hypothetical protein
MDAAQGCIKLTGLRTVPAYSYPDDLRACWFPEQPGVFVRAASRDGSRSVPKLNATLDATNAN